MSSVFSKILILVIFIVLAGGGIFVWQYFGAPEEEAIEAPEEVIPELLSVDFNPLLFASEYYPFEYKADTTMILKVRGEYSSVCLAHSPGPGIEIACSVLPTTTERVGDLAFIEFRLVGPAPLCHRLSDFSEIHFFDEQGEWIKKYYCQDLKELIVAEEKEVEEKEVTEKELLEIMVRDEKRYSDLRMIRDTLEMYYGFYGSYPALKDTSQDGEFLKELIDAGYLPPSFPFLDPQHPDRFYEYQGSATSYTLKAYIEEEGGDVDMRDGKKDNAFTIIKSE